MFVSPHGEGEFYYIAKYPNATVELLQSKLEKFKRNDLGICYGKIVNLKNDKPIIKGKGIRYVSYRLYTTKIMSYKVKKDSVTGETVCGENNMYKTKDFKLLKVAKEGQNKCRVGKGESHP